MKTDVENKDEASTTAAKRPPWNAQGGGSPVYALGMIGALVFYWRPRPAPTLRTLISCVTAFGSDFGEQVTLDV